MSGFYRLLLMAEVKGASKWKEKLLCALPPVQGRCQVSLMQFAEPIVFAVNRIRQSEQTPLAMFVRTRLAELGLKQADFCRLTGFDQGLLSRIQNSVITNLSLESVLRLALGLRTSPKDILSLIDRSDLHELVVRSYAIESGELEVSPQ